MISVFFHDEEPDSFKFKIYFNCGLWNIIFDDGSHEELEARFKSKVQALEYVGLRLINFYGGV